MHTGSGCCGFQYGTLSDIQHYEKLTSGCDMRCCIVVIASRGIAVRTFYRQLFEIVFGNSQDRFGSSQDRHDCGVFDPRMSWTLLKSKPFFEIDKIDDVLETIKVDKVLIIILK